MLTGLGFTAPALIFLIVFVLYPLVRSVKRSFYQDNLLTITPHYIGLANYRRFFDNDQLVHSIPTTAVFVVAATLGGWILGFAWALVLNQEFRGRAVLRAMSLLPWILPSTVTAFLWAWIFNAQYGVLNSSLQRVHLISQPVAWLASDHTAMAAVSAARTWQSAPWFMVMFLAGLQSLPGELVEASRVDGGGNWVVLRHVVAPHLSFTMLVAVMLGAIGNLQLFDLIYAMTGGGPVDATSVLSLQVYLQAFGNFDYGMACTIGVVWMLALSIPAIVYLRIVMPQTRPLRAV